MNKKQEVNTAANDVFNMLAYKLNDAEFANYFATMSEERARHIYDRFAVAIARTQIDYSGEHTAEFNGMIKAMDIMKDLAVFHKDKARKDNKQNKEPQL